MSTSRSRVVATLLDGELGDPRLGTTAALNSLVDLLLIQLVRVSPPEGEDSTARRSLSAPLDPITRDALKTVHREPGRDWTSTSLPHCIGVSRATLSRRCERALGQTPGT